MSKTTKIILIVVAIALLFTIGTIVVLGGIGVLLYSVFCAFEPYTPQQQLNGFESQLLHPYKFGDGYEVIETKSQNGHPDRIQDLTIKLSDDEFEKFMIHIDSLPVGDDSTIMEDKLDVKTITKYDGGCSIHLVCRYRDYGHIYFSSDAKVDYQEKTIQFHGGFY